MQRLAVPPGGLAGPTRRLVARRAQQLRVAGQDGLLQPPELGAGVDAELVGQPAAHVLVGGQRVGRLAAAVQAQHELSVELLLQRMRGNELAQLGHQLAIPAQPQVSVDTQGQRLEPPLFQGRHLTGPQQRRRHVGQRFSAPQAEGLPQQAGGLVPAAGRGGGLALGDQRAERAHVQVAVADLDEVAGRLGVH